MRLAGTDLADDQQALVAPWVAFLREVGGHEMSLRQGGVGARKVGVIVRKLAMLVAARDASRTQQVLSPRPQLAVAARNTTFALAAAGTRGGRHRLPAGSFAQRA